MKNNNHSIQFEKTTAEILDKIPDGLQIISPDFHYLYVNKAVIKQAKKKSKDDLVGHSVLALFPGFEKTPIYRKVNKF